MNSNHTVVAPQGDFYKNDEGKKREFLQIRKLQKECVQLNELFTKFCLQTN